MAIGRPPSSAPSLKRTDLAEELSKELGTFSAGAKVVHSFFDEISKALVAGEKVMIHELGRFKIVTKGVRRGRNPRTGEEKTIKSRKAVSFKPSVKIRDQVAHAAMVRREKND